ncbi:MAG: hypothetical protein NTX71_11045 [Candidatus Aureabacteria bacterium]|nr:hypothetical protein [Candidatus Auribacterota bacterium]
MKKIIACVQLFFFVFLFGCGGMMTPPPPLTFNQPLSKPFGHALAIGRFTDKSFARYSLFITGSDLQDLFQYELEKNHVFMNVFSVSVDKKDDRRAIEKKALEGKANLIMEGELSESVCKFMGSSELGIPMYLLIGTVLGFPLGFNIKAQTWQGGAEVIYRIRDIKTEKVLLARRVQAVAYRNFSIWEERTERQTNKNFVRRMLTPLVMQNLKTAVVKDVISNFKD